MSLALLAPLLLMSVQAKNGVAVGFARAQYDAPALPIQAEGKFLVSFFNGFDKPVKLLGENCSWGYGMVTFELMNPAGGSYSITRKERPWDKNWPIPVMVDPGAVVLRPINFGDGTWQGFPPGITGQATGWKARVILTVTPDWLLTEGSFWIGKVTSPWFPAKVVPG